MKNFKKLKVWKKGMDITVEVYSLTEKLPDSQKFGLATQMQRAAISITSNIAEGSSRTSDKDYKRFLEYSLGSCFELENQLIACNRLKFLSEIEIEQARKLIVEEEKMLHKLISILKKPMAKS